MKFISLLVICFWTVSVQAQNNHTETKHGYNLFNPTPADRMRGFETDRPDATESPITVDAGHIQFETDLVKTDRTSIGGVKTIQNSYNAFNFKVGLTNSLDVQFIADSYVNTKVIEGNTTENGSSFNNITIRAKQNIWGNDDGKTAMALLPFVNITTVAGGKITGGLVLPLGIALPRDWGFGTQIEIDLEDNQLSNGYHFNPSVSATVAHQLFRNIDFFAEGLVSRENELKTYEYFLNGGLVYDWKENIRFDSGIYYGLQNNSPRTYFVGLSFRI